jgi:DNA-binding LacI/PurR family transcriptional regulator
MAMVAVSRLPNRVRMEQVTAASREGAYCVTAHLLRLGHKRVAIINGPALTTARDRQSGYEDVLAGAGLPVDESLVVHCDFRQAAGRIAMQQLSDLDPRPAAVFAAGNLLTLGASQAIHERAFDIPGQVAIVGFDDMPWAMSLRPP